MAALDSNPFDDLLSSHSVFVSPLNVELGGNSTHLALDRYGQHTDNRYGHANGVDVDAGGESNVIIRDEQWRWAGPADPAARVGEELYVDHHPEDELAQATSAEQEHHHQQQQQLPARVQHGNDQSVPEVRPGENYYWGEHGEDGEASYRDNDNNVVDSDRSWGAGHERRDSAYTSGGDDNSAVVGQGPPSAVAAGSPSASRSFEDQPIRGLAGGKEMSLDELIAQGERQMQEAQARTASAKAPLTAAVTEGKPLPHPPATAPVANSPLRAPFAGGGATPWDNGEESSFAARGRRPTIGGGSGDSVRSSVASNMMTTGLAGAAGGEGGRAGALRASASMRSASFATSWSGGDTEQLGHISMGVMPANGGEGDTVATRLEQESRSERERQEFYELEMELLREEEEGGEEEGRLMDRGRQGGGAGLWGDKRDGYGEGGKEEEDRRDGLRGRLGFAPAGEAASRAG